MSLASIPRWVVIATAALLAIAILVIVVHPYFDVSSATVGERTVSLLLAVVFMLTGIALPALVRLSQQPAALARPQPIEVVERNGTRRI